MRRARGIWRRVAAAVVLAILAPLVLAGWLLFTESGLRAGLSLIAWSTNGQVSAGQPSGRLADEFRIPSLRIDTTDLKLEIDVLEVGWRAAALTEPRLVIERLALGTVVFAAAAPDAEPASPPELPELNLPLPIEVQALTLGRLAIHAWSEDPQMPGAATFELHELAARIRSDRTRFRVEHLSVRLPFGALEVEGEVSGAEEAGLRLAGALMGEVEARAYAVDFVLSGRLQAPQLQVKANWGDLAGRADALLAPFEAVPLRELRVVLDEIDPSQYDARAPQAAIAIEVELKAGSETEWVFDGPLAVQNRRPDSVDRSGLPFRELSGRLRVAPEAIGLHDLQIRLHGDGAVAGKLDWQMPGAEAALGRLQAALDWSDVQMRAIDARLPELLVSGRIDAAGDEQAQNGRLALRAGKARIDAQFGYSAGQGDAASARFEAQGEVVAFDPAGFIAGAPTGELNFKFDAEGTPGEMIAATLGWRFGASRLEGLPLSGAGRVGIEGERLALADLNIELAGNRVEAKGAWGRMKDALEVRIQAPELAALGYGLSGRVDLSAKLGGTRVEPSGRFELFAGGLELPGGVRVGALNAAGHLEAGLEGPLELALSVSEAGAVDSAHEVEAATVAVSGQRRAHTIQVEAATAAQDRLALVLEGALLEGSTGGQEAAGARWSGRLTAFELAGRVSATLLEPAGLSLARDRIALEPARLDAGERGRIELTETLWTPDRAFSRGRLTGVVAEIDGAARTRRSGRGAGPLTLGGEWDFALGKTIAGDLRIFRESGDLRLGADLTTRVGLETLELRLNAIDNRLALSWDVRGAELGSLTGAVTAVAERDPEGGWRLAPDAALLGSARFAMPSIAWLARVVQEEVVLGGALAAEFTLSGTPADPLAAGQIRGSELSIGLVEHGLELAGGELLAAFDRDRLRLTSLRFVSPNRVRPRDSRVPVDPLVRTPGSLDVSGEIALDSGAGQFRFVADRLPILQRTDRWLLVSGEGSATSTWTALDLKAALRADAGYVELADTPPPSLSDDVVIVGQEPQAGGELKVSAEVSVSLGEALYLSALGLDTRLTGELRLALRDGEPLSAVGTIATAGGSFRGYGQNLTIERGLINFQGIVDNPGLNVVALRKGLPVEAGIAVGGSVRRPVIRLVSEPNVPDPEKLSWIVLGRAPSAGSGADLGVLLPAAQALLGGGRGGGMTDQLSRSLGFDEFGIGQSSEGSARAPTSRVVGGGSSAEQGTVSGQVLTLGKRLSADLLLSFEQSLGGAQSLVKLSYQLSQRVSFVVRGGSDNAADVFYTVSFR